MKIKKLKQDNETHTNAHLGISPDGAMRYEPRQYRTNKNAHAHRNFAATQSAYRAGK